MLETGRLSEEPRTEANVGLKLAKVGVEGSNPFARSNTLSGLAGLSRS